MSKNKKNLTIDGNFTHINNIELFNDDITNSQKTIKKSPKALNTVNNNKIDDNTKDNNLFLKELLNRQLKNISPSKKLNFNDIKRICRFISNSIFEEEKCSLWNGYITNENNNLKGTYINFYFQKKKIALHRLLYMNYIENLSDDEYIKFSCDNKGKCCNINHMKKYTYIKNKEISEENNNSEKINNITNNEIIQINTDKNKLIIEL